MASTTSRIRILIDGSVDGLVRAARRAKTEVDNLDKVNSRLGKGFAGLSKVALGMTAVAGGANTTAAAVGTLVNLTPGLLLVPGAIAATGAAFATVKIGLSGFADGVKNGGEDLAKLAPNARAAATELRAMSDEATDLRKSVQNALFEGLAPALKDLGVKTLPVVKTGLTGIATELAPLPVGMAKFLSSASGTKALAEIFDNTKVSLDGIGPSAGLATEGFAKLAAFGTRYFGGLGDGITSLATKWRDFVDRGIASGSFNSALDRTGKTLQTLGRIAGNVGTTLGAVFRGLSAGGADPLASLEKMTDALARFFQTAQAQSALRELGETFRVVADVTRTVLLTALQELTPLIIAIGPAARTFATAVGNTLVSALRIAGPLLTTVAEALSSMPTVVSAAATAFVIFTIALRGATVLAGPVGALRNAIIALGVATRVTTSLGGRLGAFGSGLVAIAGVVGIAVVANELDKMNVAAAKGDPKKLDIIADSLHNIVGAGKQLASGDIGGIFQEIGDEFDELGRKFETGESPIGRFFGDLRRSIEGIKLTKIDFQVDTGPARADVQQLLGEINRSSSTVVINGNRNPAGFALREILREISEGKAEININGRTIPAQEALSYVIGLINNGSGEVLINGNRVPAGEALSQLLQQVDSSTAVITIDGNPVPGTQKITQTVALADGSTGTITIEGNRLPADGKITGVITRADGSTGTVTIDGNQTPANGKIDATVRYADGSTGTIKVDADTSAAQSAIGSFYAQWNGRTIDLRVSTAGRLAGGGPVGGFASGGAVRGGGTGTSDTAGMFALSAGEHVWTAREVRAAGGHGAVMRLRKAAVTGRLPGLAEGGGVAAAAPVLQPAAAAAAPVVRVYIGDRELRDLVRVEVDDRERATRRTVLAGAGTAF